MQNYKTLSVWHKSHRLVLETYELTAKYPKTEQYGLTSQMRRAAVSAPANIAEGCSRDSAADFVNFLRIAVGSINELEYYFILSGELGLLTDDSAVLLGEKALEIKKMLINLIKKVRASQ
ncbi:four helix bundle protein [bacterium]|nr:four helix bundle protein [bacterium]MBU1881536.1 four helix bundle protein [bacterium]